MVLQHFLAHLNTFVILMSTSLVVAESINGWRTAHYHFGCDKSKISVYTKLRGSANSACKMVFCIALTAGFAGIIDFIAK